MTKIKMDSELDAPFDTEILKLEFWEYMCANESRMGADRQ